MPVFNKFHYLPLKTRNSIRLIVLDAAANGQAPLSCSLFQGEEANYHAISYVWGEQGILSPQPLEMRHEDDISYLRITPNVDTVLRRFRSLAEPQYLWLDAICLNQDDDTEKAQQIPRMGDIYQQAEGVYIWLGPDDAATARLFKFFRKASKITTEGSQWDRAGKVTSLMRRILPQDEVSGMECVIGFFSRPWFARRWVIQEATLARQATVYCGTRSIQLSVLSAAARRIQALSISSYHFRMVTKLYTPETRRGMLELLWDFHDAACQNQKDRIAALIGLLPEDSRVTIDYTLAWFDIYRQLAAFMLEHGSDEVKRQVILHLFEFGPVSALHKECPSWVPDWSQRRRRTLPFHSPIREVDTYEVYPASPGYPSLSSFKLCNGALRISWNAALGGPRGLQVKYARSFSAPAGNNRWRAKRVIRLLEDLLPGNPKSSADILALSSVVTAAVGFRWTWREALQTEYLDEYLETLCRYLAASSNQQLPKILRHLDPLLQDFCLFSLAPAGFDSGPRYYGLGPLQIDFGDILMPVWRPGFGSDQKFRYPDDKAPVTPMDAVTMLAVRPVGELRGEKGDSVAKVIGPAVCVLVGNQDAQDMAGWFSWVQSCAGWQESSVHLL